MQAKGKITKAEKALWKVQENLKPSELPTDLETLNDEERFLLRKMGLSMKPYLLLGNNCFSLSNTELRRKIILLETDKLVIQTDKANALALVVWWDCVI